MKKMRISFIQIYFFEMIEWIVRLINIIIIKSKTSFCLARLELYKL